MGRGFEPCSRTATMSDFKASFRAAAAQRGSAAPTKEQIKALKAQKAQEAARQPVQSQKPAPQVPAPSISITNTGAPSKGLPSDFFQEPSTAKAQTSVSQPGPTAVPSAAAVAKSAGAAGPQAALPHGFFADKTADAKARGEKLPDKKDKEEEFKQFQRLMDEQIKEMATKEAEEVEEDAEAREEREAFEQRMRLEQIEALRLRKAADSAIATTSGVETENAPKIELPPRKRKVADFLRDELGGLGNEGGSSDDADDEDLVLDWRAKGV